MHITQVQQLSAWLQATDIDLLELQGPGEYLCLRRDGTDIEVVADGAEEEAAPRTVVPAMSVGVFLHGHPMRSDALASPGMRVRAGQVLGLLRVGALLLPVPAPQDGIVEGVLVEHGTPVGYGTPLLELRPL